MFEMANARESAEAVGPAFAVGTRIRTPDGDRPIESLVVGDVVQTSTGATRRVLRAVQRLVDCGQTANSSRLLPIRIAAGAFGLDLPARDLLVSPAVCLGFDLLGEMLVPIAALANGATIAHLDLDQVTYVELALDEPDSVVVEGVFAACGPASGQGGHAFAGHCRPPRPYYASGPVVEALRIRLADSLRTLCWTRDVDPFADLHLCVDGERREMKRAGLACSALVPVSARHLWLASSATTPSTVSGSTDDRLLGVCVAALSFDDGLVPPRRIAPDDTRLCVGFHPSEDSVRRWTTGRGRLHTELWDGCRGQMFLRVELAGPSLPRWISPRRGAPRAIANDP